MTGTYLLLSRILERRGRRDLDIGIRGEMVPGYEVKRTLKYGPIGLWKVVEYTDGNKDERVWELYKKNGWTE